MNIGEAISKLEHINWRYCAGNYDVAMRMAIDTLRDKQKVERYDEIMQAEREGRLLALPCKIGDTVYWLDYNRDACIDCDCFSSFYGMDSMCDKHYELFPEVIDRTNDEEHCPKHFVEIIEKKMDLKWIFWHWGQFGKTVFLTREDAEKALEEAK